MGEGMSLAPEKFNIAVCNDFFLQGIVEVTTLCVGETRLILSHTFDLVTYVIY